MARGRKKSHEEFCGEVIGRYGGEWEVVGKYEGAKIYVDIQHIPCGEIYSKRPDYILKGTRCEGCYLKEREDKFLKFFNEQANGEFTLLGEYKNFHTAVSIRHEICGKEYSVRPGNFHTGTRCPKCSRNIPLEELEFQERVFKEGNGEFVFLKPYERSATKLPLLHKKCGHIREISPNTFFSGTRCPNCYMSSGEEAVAETIDSIGVRYVREKRIGNQGVKSLRFDFYLPEYRACIEFDGVQHYTSVEHWGGEENRKGIIERDMIKKHYCHYNSIELLRIPKWMENDTRKLVVEFVDGLEGRTEWRV